MTQYGFAFRGSAAFVTDDAPNTYVQGSETSPNDNYSVTRNGITFGWTIDQNVWTQGRDRNAGGDKRFAGCVFSTDVETPALFRVDLPSAGDWTIRLALGDPSYARSGQYLSVRDDNTEFATISGDTAAANRYLDATGVERTSPADWVTNNVALSRTFSSTILRLVFGDGATLNPFVSYMLIESSGAPPAEGGWLRYRK